MAVSIAIILTLAITTAHAGARPNVILFLVDDLGWSDLGCQGSDYYRTPHIDALAESGVRFTNAYAACAVCSPTRAAILTGKYPARLMLTQWLPAGRWSETKNRMREGRFLRSLPLEETTLAEALRESGYATWHIGKWHLGGAPFSLPEHHGFDTNIAGSDHGAPGGYFYPFKGTWKIPTTNQRVLKQTLPGGREGDYLTDRLTDAALDLIGNSDESKPFFLYFPYYNVHTPLQGKPELMKKYEAIPETERQGPPAYAAMVESVDESVGRVLAALDATGLRENTLIVFTSDNGGFAKATDNAPLRANKGSHYEGGIRVPLIFAGSGVGLNAPEGLDLPVISCDLYPTILALTGTHVPPTDGRNLTPLLTGLGEVEYRKDRPLFWHYPHYNQHPQSAPVSIIRKGPWKLIEFLETDETELYHLLDDPGETNDLAEERPQEVDRLKQALLDWKQSVRADPMTPNPLFQPPTTNPK
jgi:arylsulfatase A-like enzyme